MVDGLFTFGMLETVEVPKLGPEYADDVTPVAPMGVLLRHDNRVFRYVGHVHDSGDDCKAGHPVFWYELDPATGVYEITPDIDDSFLNTGPHPSACAGVSVLTDYPATGTYGWIQVGGVVYAAPVDQGTTQCDRLSAGGTSGSEAWVHTVEGTPAVCEITYAYVIGGVNTTNSTANILLQNLIW